MNQTRHHGKIIYVDHGLNLQQVLCQHILSEFAGDFPDLTSLQIIAPTPDLNYSLRNTMLQFFQSQGKGAYIGAAIAPLRKWVESSIPFAVENKSLINNHSRQLLVLDALKQYPAQFEKENLWQVASTLLQLFDELTLQQVDPGAESEDEFTKRLMKLYRLENPNSHLETESHLVYQLWQAWQQQLGDDQLVDRTGNYVQRLLSLDTATCPHQHFYFAGLGALSRHEILFIKNLSAIRPVTLFIQADPQLIEQPASPDSFYQPLISLLDFSEATITNSKQKKLYSLAYDSDTTLQQRINALSTEASENYATLSQFVASNEEQEAIAIELQVRRWLLQGKCNIAVVTENRKLARRVRALLERAGVNLVDSVGWSLSTTSAATVIERWLECIEQDFAYQSLLDLIKSPFFLYDGKQVLAERETLLAAIYRFEQDIIVYAGIGANIDRYRENLNYQQHRLEHWESHCYPLIDGLLASLNKIAEPLTDACNNNREYPAAKYLQLLTESLQNMGIIEQLLNDEAGQKVISEIEHMQTATERGNPIMNWYDFRTWFASALEDHHYSPVVDASHVRLLNLQQSNSGYYDALIIGSVTASEMPGKLKNIAFFNQGIRFQMGLPDWKTEKHFQFYLFRRLLQSCGELLLSYCAEKENEWQEPAPWLQSLVTLHSSTFSTSLDNTELPGMISNARTEVLESRDVKLPSTQHQPAPVPAENLLPQQFSASRHQRLVNCPYLFFCGDLLGLRPQDDIVAELQKSEYGSKVHSILQQYHEKIEKLTFENIPPEQQQQEQLSLLSEISGRLFQREVEDNFLHRGWLKRWLDHAEAYLQWQQQHQQTWHFSSAELNARQQLDEALALEGRIDRVDTSGEGLALIDYKTGSRTASQDDVDNGEDVQLVSYALLLEKVIDVQYLKLDEADGKVKSGARLSGETLSETSMQALTRLKQMIDQLKGGQGLIANGSPDVCEHCQMSGICRRQYWC